MRTLHFWCDRDNNTLVQGLNAANPAPDLVIAQSDALKLVVHNLQRNTASPALTPFVEKPLEFSTVRFAIGYVDAAPRSGSFKLKVGDQTTTELTWPSDLSSTTLITTWKATVLAALKALSNVADGDIIAVDPVGTPAHFFYFQWTDPDNTTPIEVVELKLIPWIEATIEPGLSAAGYTQLVKLAQFPLAMTSNFARPNPPTVLIIETRAGASGTNAEQTIVVPSGAMGSVSLQWNGASTKTMAVASLTAASIAQALNDIVEGGGITPSFAVEQRQQREGSRFAVSFIGPLAGAAQSLIGRTMHDQESLPYATGTLDLKDHLGIEQALNGAESVKLKLELVIDEEGDETFLRTVTIINDMTAGSTEAAADAAGAVALATELVYVDSGLGDAFLDAAPGLTFVPPSAGSSLLITHGLNTWRPGVRVTLHAVNHTIFAADPSDLASALVSSRALDDTEYSVVAESANIVRVTLPWSMVTDATNALDRRLLAVDIFSPVSELTVFPHKHDWDNVLESLPSGMTLRAKLAALEAGVVSLAGGITIKPDRIDLVALTSSLISLLTKNSELKSLFTTLMTSVVSDSEVMKKIATELRNHTEFTDTVKTVFADAALIKTLTEALIASTDYRTSLRTTILDTIQAINGASVQNDTVPFLIPDLELTLPVAETANDSLPNGDVDGFFPLPAAVATSLTNDGNITGRLPEATPSLKGHYRTVVTKARTLYRTFTNGQLVYCTGYEWFPGTIVAGKMFTTDCDVQLFTVAVNDRMLSTGTRFSLLAGVTLQQLGNCEGRWLLRLERCTAGAEITTVTLTGCSVTIGGTTVTCSSTSALIAGMSVSGTGIPVGARVLGITNSTHFTITLPITASGTGLTISVVTPGNLSTLTVNDVVLELPLEFDATAITHTIGFSVDRTGVSTFTAKKTLYTDTTNAVAPTNANFVMRATLSRFDTENVLSPRGVLNLTMKGARAGIVKI